VQGREVARPPRASKHDRAPLVRGVFTCFGCVLVVSWLGLLPPLRLTSSTKGLISDFCLPISLWMISGTVLEFSANLLPQINPKVT